METTDKYYTPAVEDIHVGYETEEIIPDFSRHIDLFLPEGATKEEYDEAWSKFYCTDKFESRKYIIPLEEFPRQTITGRFRTPYLTKEQIEAEGWTPEEVSYSDILVWGTLYRASKRKSDVIAHHVQLYNASILIREIVTNIEGKDISITKFIGKCPSINEFRKICKLIGI